MIYLHNIYVIGKLGLGGEHTFIQKRLKHPNLSIYDQKYLGQSVH